MFSVRRFSFTRKAIAFNYSVWTSGSGKMSLTNVFFNPADPRGITQGGLPGFPTQLDIFRRWCQGLILSLIHI